MGIFRLDEALVCEPRPDSRSTKEAALGLAARYLGGNRSSAGTLVRSLMSAIETDQYMFWVDHLGRPAGFVTWCFASPAVIAKLHSKGSSSLTLADWRSGAELCIVHFAAPNGYAAEVSRELRDFFSRNIHKMSYFRTKGTQRVLKQVIRRTRCSPSSQRNLRDQHNQEQKRQANLHWRASEFQRTQELGSCIHAGLSSTWAKQMPFSVYSRALRGLLELRQFRIYRNRAGEVAGMLTWVWLSGYTIERIGECPLDKVHPSEWTEGSTLCIYHAATTEEAFEEMKYDIDRGLFPEQTWLLLYVAPTHRAAAQLINLDRSDQRDLARDWLVCKGAAGV